MLVLGIESSCDDTAAAVVEDGRKVLSSVVSSQDDIHAKYGGIVPELASRRHIESIIPVVREAIDRAGVTLGDIGGIAVTQGPGLVGSLLVGLSFAKSLSYATGVPFTGVNHIESHPLAAFLHEKDEEKNAPSFPFVSLIVSGGHTTLLLMESFTSYRILGQTIDDAAGEAFDKVAKLIGLGYPGGAAIDALAKEGDANAFAFTRPHMARRNLDFSFSGLKTAVLTAVRSIEKEDGAIVDRKRADIAASFQEAAVDVLVAKALWALEETGATDLVVAGGVACNSRLRERVAGEAAKKGFNIFIPAPCYCSDNGAMIAALGYRQMQNGNKGTLDMNALPTWEGF
ncbi:MAG: tRNA (adenosine(37)-N6)-threonylcarbamoyltransferase complex transferase subunit TsaD [Deltaproteobacteria bacterium RBG_19FT_COMBO_58_16]|nr:MAG: tRNA (adenosine(37)-N6)-threonylcarbamoyltransferase complex transferase subunit TsaD [Deltaproteobacteria bacterium RBG_19FT_COMBO_58_16]